MIANDAAACLPAVVCFGHGERRRRDRAGHCIGPGRGNKNPGRGLDTLPLQRCGNGSFAS